MIITWREVGPNDVAEAFQVPEGKAVTVSIHGEGCLLGAVDADDYSIALNTGEQPIRGGSIGAVHVRPAYRFLRPGPGSGRCELCISQ